MAGPGKHGPPARGGEQVDYVMLKGDVLRLRKQGMTHAEIAAVLDYERSTITRLIPRIMREVLIENGAEEVRMLEFLRLDELSRRMEASPRLIGDENGPDPRYVDAYLKVSKAKRELVGADAPKKLDVTYGETDQDLAAEQLAARITRFAELADKIARNGIGSGRAAEDIVDAVVVEDEDHGEDAGGEGQATGSPGTGEDLPLPIGTDLVLPPLEPVTITSAYRDRTAKNRPIVDRHTSRLVQREEKYTNLDGGIVWCTACDEEVVDMDDHEWKKHRQHRYA